jgi:hypothetical protein
LRLRAARPRQVSRTGPVGASSGKVDLFPLQHARHLHVVPLRSCLGFEQSRERDPHQ